MQNFNKNQRKLALTLAHDIEHSGCNVGESISVLIEHVAGLIGRHAPNPVEIERFCNALSREFTQSARVYHLLSDINPINRK